MHTKTLLLINIINIDSKFNLTNTTTIVDFLTPSEEELYKQLQDAKICLMGWLVMFIWVTIICFATKDFWLGNQCLEDDKIEENQNNLYKDNI
uniref:Uncharacterized protein n=1 Tax=Strongyloides stercoralis TaxID=6248 RepID=A0A0K0DZS4_STRER